jgi:hypothetical protein
MNSQIPLIDEENPFYCPSFPAAAYLATLRQARQSNPFLFQDMSLRSFFWKIGLCFAKENQNYTSNVIAHDTLDAPSWPSSPDVQSPIILARKQVLDDLPDLPVLRRGLPGLALKRASKCITKRRRESSEHEDPNFLGGPSKRGRSSQSVHTSPVNNTGTVPLSYTLHRHDPLAVSYQDVPRTLAGVPLFPFRKCLPSLLLRVLPIHILTICVSAWVYESETGDETPIDLSNLLNRLEMVIPGTGVHQTFLGDPLAILRLTHQKITNVLADRGIDRRNVSSCHEC